ncbi:MAG: FAD-binding oxidoreductase [Pseudomonadota bacterium]
MQHSADVAIVGGGIVGLMTARNLAAEGLDVVLLEAGDLGAAASGANAGSIHLQLQYAEFIERGPDWARAYAPCLRFLSRSLELWGDLADELGADLGIKLTGGLIVAKTEDQMRFIREKNAIEAEAGVITETIGRNELLAMAPYLADDSIGGGFCAMEGKANPLRVTPALADAVVRSGVRIMTKTAVSGIERNGAAYCLSTDGGDVRAGRIVNATGALAARVGAMVGTVIPVNGHPLQVTVTEPVAPIIPHLVYSAAGKLSLKQLENGGCVVGGGWPARQRANGTLATDPMNFAGNMVIAAGVAPAVAQARALRSWTAWVNGTPDSHPIIGEDPNNPGIFHAVYPWVGFSAGPMTARVAADLVLGRAPEMPLSGISRLFH